MPEQKIQPGDVVQLISGGPKMTVILVEGAYVNCLYYNETTHLYMCPKQFPVVALKKISHTAEKKSGVNNHAIRSAEEKVKSIE
jgi:uncharacterized protein YodC (DUF2158 family)